MQHITLQIILSLLLTGLHPAEYIHNPIDRSFADSEVCDNGIDDDGDGLVDIMDSDCDCQPLPLDYIPNASFELHSTCPDNYSQIDRCESWIEPGYGTPDYFHNCGFKGTKDFHQVIEPIPDGDACVAFSNSPDSDIGYKEYIGVCLKNPLSNGKGYSLEFSIGFKDAANSPPTTLSVFGSTTCDALSTYDSSSEDCPTTQAAWTELADKSVSGPAEGWKRFSIELHPQQDIQTIIIGGNCEIMLEGKDNYYFLDDLKLFEIFSLPGPDGQPTSKPYIRPASGHPCSKDLVLETLNDPTYDYQWYRNGAAISGATSATYAVPANETGDYQVRISDGSLCTTSAAYEVRINSYTTYLERTICQGLSLQFLDSTFSEPGLHTYMLSTAEGCDSLIEIDLSVSKPDEVSIDRTICSGEQFTLGNHTYDESGNYKDTLENVYGCDSIVHLSLEVVEEPRVTIQQIICEGERYQFGENWLSQEGTYSDTLSTESGCDSIVQLDLYVEESTQSTIERTICDGSTFPFGGKELSKAGTYRDTFTNSAGCDSVIRLQLNVQESYMTEREVAICSGEHFTFNGRVLSTGGTYEATYPSAHGCDSTIRIHLTVHSNGVSLGSDRSVELGKTVGISPAFDQPGDIVDWSWTSDPSQNICSHCAEVQFTPTQSALIQITAEDGFGCRYSDQMHIQVTNKTKGLYIPNAFSPDGDGVNDYFRPYASDKIQSIERMTIFNRAGHVVFERTDLEQNDQEGWDGSFHGRKAMPGVFIYLIEVEYLDGSTRQFKGDLTLIR